MADSAYKFRLKTATAEYTRPANTDAYTALDAISDSTTAPTDLEFTLTNAPGGSGKILKAKILTDQSTNTSDFRLHLFSAAPTPINDNAAYTLLYASAASYIGAVTFAAAATEGTGSTAAGSTSTGLNIPFTCAAGSKKVYGLLESVDGFTPASAQKFHLELVAEVAE